MPSLQLFVREAHQLRNSLGGPDSINQLIQMLHAGLQIYLYLELLDSLDHHRGRFPTGERGRAATSKPPQLVSPFVGIPDR